MAALIVALLGATTADATIIWSWSNAGTGTESGTFTTDGTLAGGLASAGTYTLSDFSILTSGIGFSVGSVSGGQYAIVQPSVGFIWDGTAPTQFFRDNGTFTNGFAMDAIPSPPPGNPFRVVFDVGAFFVEDADEETTILSESLTVNLSPLPEPGVGVLLLTATLAVARRGTRRKLTPTNPPSQK